MPRLPQFNLRLQPLSGSGSSVHLHGAGADAFAVVIELHIGMISEQGHGHRGVHDAVCNHERREPLAERVVVKSGLPDRDLFCLPRFIGADRHGAGGDKGHVATTRGAGVLGDGDRVQVNHPGFQLPVLCRGGRSVLVFPFAGQRIVESPMLDVALTSLHDDTTHAGVPAGIKFLRVRIREMQIRIRHHEFFVDLVEAHLAIAFLERQRMGDRHRLAIDHPLVHAPEVGMMQLESHGVHHAGDQRKLLGGTDRPTDTRRIVRRRLLPGIDVFQSLGTVEILEGVIEHHLEPGARQLQQLLGRELGCRRNDVFIKGGEIPPVGGKGAEAA